MASSWLHHLTSTGIRKRIIIIIYERQVSFTFTTASLLLQSNVCWCCCRGFKGRLFLSLSLSSFFHVSWRVVAAAAAYNSPSSSQPRCPTTRQKIVSTLKWLYKLSLSFFLSRRRPSQSQGGGRKDPLTRSPRMIRETRVSNNNKKNHMMMRALARFSQALIFVSPLLLFCFLFHFKFLGNLHKGMTTTVYLYIRTAYICPWLLTCLLLHFCFPSLFLFTHNCISVENVRGGGGKEKRPSRRL